MKETEAERQKLQDINEKYNVHYNKKKETIASLTQELETKKKEIDELTKIHDKMVKEAAPLHEKYECEVMKNKGLGECSLYKCSSTPPLPLPHTHTPQKVFT